MTIESSNTSLTKLLTACARSPMNVQRDAHNQAETNNLEHIGARKRVDGVRRDEVAQQVSKSRRLAFQYLFGRLRTLQRCANPRIDKVHNHQPQPCRQQSGRRVVDERDDAEPSQIARVQPRRRRNERGDD
jgi:hypothetical protein